MFSHVVDANVKWLKMIMSSQMSPSLTLKRSKKKSAKYLEKLKEISNV